MIQVQPSSIKNVSLTSTVNESAIKSMFTSTAKRQPKTQGNSRLIGFDGLTTSKALTSKRLRTQPQQQPLFRNSSATLRHTSPNHRFPKEQRFKTEKCAYMDLQQIRIPATLSRKSCTFGKGNKQAISINLLKHTKNIPSPDRYDISRKDMPNGKTFGISWQNYDKTYILHRKDAYAAHFTKDFPPSHFQTRQKIGHDKKKFTMYGRLKMFTEVAADSKKHVPGPVHVINDKTLMVQKGLNNRNFGFGERMNIINPKINNPAPNTYDIKGFADDKN